MTDLISRRDAVNEIHKYFVEEINKTPYTKDEDGDDVYTDMPTVNSLLVCNKELAKRIKALPSASGEVDGYTEWLEKLIVDMESFEWICENTPCPEWCSENCSYASIQAECLRHIYGEKVKP